MREEWWRRVEQVEWDDRMREESKRKVIEVEGTSGMI